MSLNSAQAFRTAFAVLAGMAIPSLVFGRVVFAICFSLSFIAMLASGLHRPIWRELVAIAKSPIGLIIFGTLAIWTVSSMLSNFPIRSLEATTRTALFVGLATVVNLALRKAPDLSELCMQTLVFSALACTALAILEMIALPELYWGLRFKGWVSTPLKSELKGFSALALMLAPLMALALWNWTGRLRRVAALALFVVVLLALLTGNRSVIAGFLGVAAAVAIAAIARRGIDKYAIWSALGVVTLVAVTIGWLHYSRQSAVQVAPPGDWLFPVWLIDFERQTIWQHVLEIARKSPWLGVGANTINFTPGADAPLPGHRFLHIVPAHPHNWVVEVFAEVGILGLISLAIVIMVAAYLQVKQYKQTLSPGALAALAIMAGYWVSGLFNFSYWSAWWQLSFVLAIAISTAGRGPHEKQLI